MKYYLPIHINGDNRGCEAITKGTALILECDKQSIEVYSTDIKLDNFLGLNKYVTLISKTNSSFLIRTFYKVRKHLIRNVYKRKEYGYKRAYSLFLNRLSQGDIMLSTGGDMLCYDNNEVIYTNEYLHKKGIKTVLWGCSVGQKNLTPEKVETLKHFSLIYTRESLTYQVLLNLGLKNISLYPDPAFILNPEKCKLPEMFSKGDVIGLNLSNFVAGENSDNAMFTKGLEDLIVYIFNKLKMSVLLVPHVLWDGQDDRIISEQIYNKFKEMGNIQILKSEMLNYCQIRYVISNCKFFIGARTHSVISAYSTSVPTLALGYSIKSQGIARDLNLSLDTVVDCVNMVNESEILEKFIYLQEHEMQIKQHLLKVMPEYKAKVFKVRQELDNL